MKIFTYKWKLLVFAFFFLFVFSGYAFAALKGIAVLKEFTGEVMIKNAGSWTRPEKDLRLYSGAKIVTKQGTAQVVFDDGATMYVDVFSSIRTMDQMRDLIPGSGKQVRLRSIRIMLGRTKYQEQPAKGRKTQIELPTAVAALRGTGGWFGADETGESLGKLYEGVMDTSGIFKEIIPKILNLARALNSSTWQASIGVSGAADNDVLNVQEVQAELNTFIKNTDPAIQESVKQTLSQVTNVLADLETKQAKVQQAQQIKQNSENQIKKATDETPEGVVEANSISARAADIYIAATKDSINSDIVLILETLKGDAEGMATARQAKAQNDRALEIADNATQLAGNAAAMASIAVSDIQRNTAIAVARAASNTLEAAASTIKTSNASAWLMARDDQTGTDKAENLGSLAAKSLATAEKSVLLAGKAMAAVKAATTKDDAILAQTLASAAEKSSEAVQNALQVSNLAARAITEQNLEKAASLTQTAESAAQLVESVDSAVDAIDNAFDNKDISGVNDASDTLDEAVQETQDETQETIETAAEEDKAEEDKVEEDKAEEDKVEEDKAEEDKADEEDTGDEGEADEPEPEPETPSTQDDQAASPV